MKRIALWVLCCLTCGGAFKPAAAQTGVYYTLLEGSYFIDDCPVCGRPTIQQPLRGSFELVLVQNTAPYTKYALRNINWTTGPGPTGERHITGSGTYVRFEEFALLQDLTLAVEVKDAYTNRLAYFTNDTRVVQQPFPLIQATVRQTNGTWLQVFSMELLAAPVREIWFSTTKGFTSTNRAAPSNQISAGDLLSNNGRVVKKNLDLVGRLGVMPIVLDLGLDSVQVTRRGEILFSLPHDVFSETLGTIQHGDLLSNRGAIVKKNQALLAAFHPVSSADAGLDGFQVMPDGEILFSTRSNVTVSSTITLRRGDILSDRGRVYMTQQQLLANYRPVVTNQDFGLDAFQIFPSGEIWFSVEQGFADSRLGTIQSGDLLSSRGYRVFSNQELVSRFGPADPSADYGLDAVFVVTDMQLPKAAPRIVKRTWHAGTVHLEWDGDGDVFQVESAQSLNGPWEPCSAIVPELSWDTGCDTTPGGHGYYRVRQW